MRLNSVDIQLQKFNDGVGGLFVYSVTPEHVFDNFLNLDLGPDL